MGGRVPWARGDLEMESAKHAWVLVELAVHQPTTSRHDLHENLDLGRLQIMQAPKTNPRQRTSNQLVCLVF